ncbi:hypothetical protein LEP1GSC074_3644 [Leptospira noguchii str. Hook]|nr:hypothetical protein LEP1GSC074_3644 [Leptospira noguchii str. Hook]
MPPCTKSGDLFLNITPDPDKFRLRDLKKMNLFRFFPKTQVYVTWFSEN